MDLMKGIQLRLKPIDFGLGIMHALEKLKRFGGQVIQSVIALVDGDGFHLHREIT